MPRIARVVVPDLPHHITQRGNRRQQTFFQARDYELYLALLDEWMPKHGVRLQAYCLMPNHVHLMVVPETSTALAQVMSEVHRRYSSTINLRNDWRGHLWQGRFFSCPIERENTFLACASYVLLNPVRAGLVDRADHWPYSNAHALFRNRPDRVADHSELLALGADWAERVGEIVDVEAIRKATRTGRPFGSVEFVEHLERTLKRRLLRRNPGPRAPETQTLQS